jgi:hypothetical protein
VVGGVNVVTQLKSRFAEVCGGGYYVMYDDWPSDGAYQYACEVDSNGYWYNYFDSASHWCAILDLGWESTQGDSAAWVGSVKHWDTDMVGDVQNPAYFSTCWYVTNVTQYPDLTGDVFSDDGNEWTAVAVFGNPNTINVWDKNIGS